VIDTAGSITQTGTATASFNLTDATAYKVGGVAGVSFSGAVTNITVVNGLVTAVS
jgi:hypothetical protein